MIKLNSLAARFFATSAGWTLVVLPLAGLLIDHKYRTDALASFDASIEKLVEQISADSFGSQANEPQTPGNRYEPLFEVTHSGWYWQIQPTGTGVGPRLVSASLATGKIDSPSRAGLPRRDDRYYWSYGQGPVGDRIRICEVITSLNDLPGHTRYSVLVAGPADWTTETVRKFRAWLATALAVAGLGLIGATWVQVRFGLSPLGEIERGLTAIRSGEASRLDGELPAEIKPLQEELNALITSNEDILDRARTQVGNLAHALKTPLAVIVNEAHGEKSAFGGKVAEQASLMRDHIGHYLGRARMAARTNVIGRVTPVGPTVEPLVRTLERLHAERGLSIDVDCPPDARFQGEKHDLEEMLGNLLDNACKWARGRVWLTVSNAADPSPGKTLRVDVADDGPGVPPELRARLGKRGARLDETAPGSGLGLSIVKDLAQSYRGRFTMGDSKQGGLLARLELPAA